MPHHKVMDTITNYLKSGLRYACTWKFWKEFLILTLGMFVAAAGVYYFLVPSKLVIGSISGLSIVVSAIFEQFGIVVKVSTVVLIINAILLVLAYFLIGSEFGIKTAYTALILGPMMDLWAVICPYEKLIDPSSAVPSVMGDLWFDLICFVLILSISQTIMFSINASTGGLDILAKIVNKYLHFDIGMSVTIAGVVICCTAFAVNPFRLVIIGLIGTWINGLMVDYFTAGLNKRRRVCIVSDQYDEIRSYICDHIQRSCTLFAIEKGYTKEKGYEVEAILTKEEFSSLMAFIKDRDIKAFITAGNVSEIYGLWSKHKKLK